SLTWGAGVSESERYTGVAEALLNKIDAEKKIEFVNLAHSGAPLTSYRDRLFQFGETLDPDLLTVGFCLNDPQQKQQDFSEERQAYRRRNKGLLLLALDVRYYFPNLGESLNKGIMRWGEINGDFPSWDEALDRTYNPESTSWREFEQALADISKWNSDHTLPTPLFLILNQGSSTVDPTYYSNPDPLLKRFIRWWNQAGEAASRQGFRVINHEEEFRDQLDGKVLGVNIADGHPSAAEHKIYGEKLAHVIETEYVDIDEPSASE
ncbi:MAG: SGNH/GDSL hydrolase family protein, partial [Bdellovibrionales bacterium]|nr:SGNH/GDSL hydrolase family protein [Bdellovibrionales bacterium]